MGLSKSQFELAKSLISILIKKIDRDQPFIHDRMKEWVETMPKPVPKPDGSKELDALARASDFHISMTEIDMRNSLFGRIWPKHVRDNFQVNLDGFYECWKSSEIDPSIENLFYYHSAILDRASGNFGSAINNIQKASEILSDYIKGSDKVLLRYNRNLILNMGHESDFFRRLGDHEKAISISEEMLQKALNISENPGFLKFEEEQNFCPIVSWAYYQACEAHLGREDWDTNTAAADREYVFNTTFTNMHYLPWTPPTLLQILTNDVWSQRYPDYTEKLANQLYTSTSPNAIALVLRSLSVAFGRVQLRLASVPALAALVIVAYYGISQLTSGGATITHDDKPVLVELIDQSIEEAVELTADSLQVGDSAYVRNGLVQSVADILSNEDPTIAVRQGWSDPSNEEMPIILASPSNGNEQGIGPGVYLV